MTDVISVVLVSASIFLCSVALGITLKFSCKERKEIIVLKEEDDGIAKVSGDHVPERKYKTDVGYDLFSAENKRIPARSVATIRTGIKIKPPEGTFAKVEGRSSLAKVGIFPVGGIIDPGYRGEVIVVLYNGSSVPYEVKKGERVAQLVFYRVATPDIVKVKDLEVTDRNEKGFGSTGR